jgi:hypothetical protein
VKSIDNDTDISRLARKVMKQCKHIPSQWIYQVEEALTAIKDRDDIDHHRDIHKFTDPSEVVVNKLDKLLDLLYGSTDDKIDASLEILQISYDIADLEIIADHNQLIAALARIYSDQSIYSPQLTFNISKVFLSLSNYEEFHHILMKYQVGSTMMTITEREIGRCITGDRSCRQGNEGDVTLKNDNGPSYCIIQICISALMRFSDNPEVLCKMMKKGLVDILSEAILNVDLPLHPKKSVLSMLHKASIFGETAQISGNTENLLIEKLVTSLDDSNDIIIHSVLLVLYNLSFSRECRHKMIKSGLPSSLATVFRNPLSISLLYQISFDREQRSNILNNELLEVILSALDSVKADASLHLRAALVNFTCDPVWAEALISRMDSLLGKVTRGDILIAKIVRNIAHWTFCIQCNIAFSGDLHNLESMSREPNQFIELGHDESDEELHDPYRKYEEKKFWSEQNFNEICTIIQDNLEKDAGPFLLEMVGTLNRLTCVDLPPSNKRKQTTYFVTLIRKILALDASHIDIKLEAIILCSKLCEDNTSAYLIAESHIIHDLVLLWEQCDHDHEIHIQILHLSSILLQFEETRNTLLMGTGKWNRRCTMNFSWLQIDFA